MTVNENWVDSMLHTMLINYLNYFSAVRNAVIHISVRSNICSSIWRIETIIFLRTEIQISSQQLSGSRWSQIWYKRQHAHYHGDDTLPSLDFWFSNWKSRTTWWLEGIYSLHKSIRALCSWKMYHGYLEWPSFHDNIWSTIRVQYVLVIH
jgi:hypothetical protein